MGITRSISLFEKIKNKIQFWLTWNWNHNFARSCTIYLTKNIKKDWAFSLKDWPKTPNLSASKSLWTLSRSNRFSTKLNINLLAIAGVHCRRRLGDERPGGVWRLDWRWRACCVLLCLLDACRRSPPSSESTHTCIWPKTTCTGHNRQLHQLFLLLKLSLQDVHLILHWKHIKYVLTCI